MPSGGGRRYMSVSRVAKRALCKRFVHPVQENSGQGGGWGRGKRSERQFDASRGQLDLAANDLQDTEYQKGNSSKPKPGQDKARQTRPE